MTDDTSIPEQDPDVERMPLAVYTERAYLDYSMYVINDRALPDARTDACSGWANSKSPRKKTGRII